MAKITKFTWKIGGEAGFGIKSAGISFAKACFRAGYHAFDYTEYPSLIRGGHNTYQVTVSDREVRSVDRKVDILVALNKRAIVTHMPEMNASAAVLYDGDVTEGIDNKNDRDCPLTDKNLCPSDVHFLHVPFSDLANKAGGSDIMRNTVALGATLALIDLPSALLKDIIKEIFRKKPDVIDVNIKAMQLGYHYIKEHYADLDFKISLKQSKQGKRMYISGNEAVALGALAAGCNFYSGYPMTPSSEILHYMARKAVSENVIFKHAEDEISVINMALGAAHVGARAMCATSGGGFSLMTESLGLAGITETPVVIVNVQRPGPATGLPTWTEQSDLRFMLHAAQGEFPRIVLAPGDLEECFYLTAEAFNLAEKYQTPVILLSDKTLGEGMGSTMVFDENKVKIDRGKLLKQAPKDYKRYEITKDGISRRTLPGMERGIFCANSDEHNEYGYSDESAEVRAAQVEKRARKLVAAAKELDGVHLYGPKNAECTLVAWGSTKGAVLDAIDLLPEEHQKKFRLLHLNVLWPFPAEKVKKLLNPRSGVSRRARLPVLNDRIILIEGNSEAQLGGVIRQMTGIEIQEKILKYNGRSFFADELAEKLLKLS